MLCCVAAKVSSNPGSCQSISVRACTVSSNFGECNSSRSAVICSRQCSSRDSSYIEHSTVWSAGRASTNTGVRIVNDGNSLNVLCSVAAKVSSNPGSCQSISVRAGTVSSNFVNVTAAVPQLSVAVSVAAGTVATS